MPPYARVRRFSPDEIGKPAEYLAASGARPGLRCSVLLYLLEIVQAKDFVLSAMLFRLVH
jgi:hypothetical protein